MPARSRKTRRKTNRQIIDQTPIVWLDQTLTDHGQTDGVIDAAIDDLTAKASLYGIGARHTPPMATARQIARSIVPDISLGR